MPNTASQPISPRHQPGFRLVTGICESAERGSRSGLLDSAFAGIIVLSLTRTSTSGICSTVFTSWTICTGAAHRLFNPRSRQDLSASRKSSFASARSQPSAALSEPKGPRAVRLPWSHPGDSVSRIQKSREQCRAGNRRDARLSFVTTDCDFIGNRLVVGYSTGDS